MAEIIFFVFLPVAGIFAMGAVLRSRTTPNHWTLREVISAWLVPSSKSKSKTFVTMAEEIAAESDGRLKPSKSLAGAEIIYDPILEESRPDRVCGDASIHFSDPGFVYLMRRLDGAVKIGITGDVRTRHATLCRQCGEIELLDFYPCSSARALEKYLHNLLRLKSQGGEWFELDEREIGVVKHLITDHLNFEKVMEKFLPVAS